jgi:two-component system response regulator PilR (NtrC family)
VAKGRFRQDLFYRLNVIEVRVPPLRDRLEDVPQLSSAILQRIAERTNGPLARLSPAATAALRAYRFPGNVRELENILERAVALAGDDVLMADDLMLPGAEVDLPLDAEPIPADEAGPAAQTAEVEAAAVEYVLVDGVPSSLPSYLDSLEREAIRRALERTRYNRTAAAQLLGITFRQLRYRMQRLAIK